ncbi:5-dehydro-2-deoxygluconokinase [uncultured Aquabacterium sp.]|uniref:bifunctional 5-dehydro-2-deoxygluconokinase/5-dehydro-2- deoxyphosphogluconate aldolase n=1 Tax=Aquabacterium sp. TaxID=1872578 RepID=UPI0025F724CE|nr:5-dehydro-2-deoxygluconokinase [uncultured Aquabacterium sp.]
MSTLSFPADRPIDIACLGRLAVDLYAQQVGCALEDASSFAKYLGGSSANIAFGTARLGLKSAMISRVGNEQMGRFLLNTLTQEGCDVSQVQIDPQRLTGLVLLGLKDRDTFPLLFYRENCADMALDANGIDEAFIAKCRALLVTGTHLSTPQVRDASRRALAFAGQHRVVRVLDIDYRPVLWGLTTRGDGETRFVADARVTSQIQEDLPRFELIIGTEEEFLIAGGVPDDIMASLRAVRAVTRAALVVKRGAMGCSFIPGAVPASLDEAETVQGERVEVLNVLGAGDAFASGLLSGLLRGKCFADAAAIANACGAIVVSRHACAPAMPTPDELAHWFSGHRHPRPDRDPVLSHLHRVTAARPQWPEVYVMAFDHRSQFYELARENGADEARIPELKRLIARAASLVADDPATRGKIGVLVDDLYGEASLHDVTGRGWWVGRPIELPGSCPLRFDRTLSLATKLQSWPREQVVKCLVFYHPDHAVDLRLEQERTLLEVWEATRASGHELLLEVIPPKGSVVDGDIGDAVVRAVKRLYNIGIKPEWWKLGVMPAQAWQALGRLVAERDPYCRGAVILGLNQPMDELLDGFRQARDPIVKGFMIGRTTWAQPSAQWLRGELNDQAFTERVAANFRVLIEGWRAARAAA